MTVSEPEAACASCGLYSWPSSAGWISVIVAMFVGFFAAFVPAAVLFARHGKGARKSAIPLGPFLALGGVVALFWGDAVLDWYRGLGAG